MVVCQIGEGHCRRMAPFKLKRYDKNPILSPDPKSSWENRVITNPGAIYEPKEKKVYMLYRAAGMEPEHKIYMGLATSTNGYDFKRVSDQPAFRPGDYGIDGGCVEDARIHKIGDWYVVTYGTRPFPPGYYWLPEKERPWVAPKLPEDLPWLMRTNAMTGAIAFTKDFKTWYRGGRQTSALANDHDVVIFDQKIGGKWWLIHRAEDLVGPKHGTPVPAMWIYPTEDLLHFPREGSRLLIKPKYWWEEKKMGASNPPIQTPHGWLVFYHGLDVAKSHYHIGAMLVDRKDPTKVLHRMTEPMLSPETPYELDGYYSGVCFPCGHAIIDGTFFMYYGGADKYVAVATCKFQELIDHVRSCPA